jgi:type II secretory pathway predicted ATPase ExeA
MYQEFFGFTSRPFSAVPSTDLYFPGQAIETARRNLVRCIERAAGCGLVIGSAGTGKSLLCQVLAEQFRDSMIPVLLSNVCVKSRKDLLQAILFEVNLPYQNRYEGELRLSLMDFLSPGNDREAMLLIVDEAHALPLKAFEELRLLTNLVRGGISRVRLVLAGSPALEERLADPSLASLNQRTVARGYLGSFTNAETCQYVRAQTARAGGDPDGLWSDEALQAVHQTTDGVPRLINQLCDHTLLMAAASHTHRLDEQRVAEAWANLQQLPLPVHDAPAAAGASPTGSVVEFGSLDDDSPSIADGDAAVEDFADEPAHESQSADVAEPHLPTAAPFTQIEDEQVATRVQPLKSLEDELADATAEDAAEEVSTVQIELALDRCDQICCDKSSADEVVLDDFAGMEAGNVVQLAPSMHALYAGPEEAGAGTHGDDADSIDSAAGQAAASPPTASAQHTTWASHVLTSSVLQNSVLQSSEFVTMSSLRNASQPDIATETSDFAADNDTVQRPAEEASPDGATTEVPTLEPTIFADALHAPQTEIYVDERPEVVRDATMQFASSTPERRSHDAARPDDPPTAAADPGDASRSTAQNPLIPVRPREYRQLFAKLRAQTTQ